MSGACTPAVLGNCTTDENCDFGQICDQATQTCLTPTVTDCTDDSMCAKSQRCNTLTGVCIDRGPACAGDEECSGGQHCDIPNAECVQCLDASQCAADQTCIDNTCVQNMTGVCSTDPQCSPPTQICVSGACTLGCGQPNGVECMNGQVCDTNTGRCVSIRGPCMADPDCNPPTEVCEFGQCIPGCTEFGGVQCPGGQQCNPSTGRCTQVGDICLSDLECNTPSEICNLVTGGCDPGCAMTGCTSPDTCDQASGHCFGSRMCMPDRLEPNDTFAQASAGGGLQTQLTICAGDVDFHRFTLGAGDDVTITVDFVNGEGNIDIELVNAGGSVVAMSNGTGNNETIQYTAAAAGDYAVRVFLTQDLGPTPGNTYSIRIDTQASPCPDDSFEDNDSPFLAPLVSAGSTNGLNVCDGDDDYFNIYVNAGETITVNVLFSQAEGDIDLALLNQLTLPVATSASVTDNESVTYTQQNGGLLKILVTLYQDMGSMPGNPYQLQVIITQGQPQTCPADSFEENDTRATAKTISTGNHTNLNTCTGDDDYYQITLAANDQIDATASFTNGEGDIDLELLDGSGTVLDSSSTSNNSENVSFTVVTAGTYYLHVLLYADAGSTLGNTYSLNVSVSGSNPVGCPVDTFEPNDTPTTAPTMSLGSYPNLGACGDDDYYAIPLTSGDSINMDVLFTHAEGDIDIELLGPDGTVAATSESTTNNENIAGTANVSGVFTLHVYLYQDLGTVQGNTYELSLTP